MNWQVSHAAPEACLINWYEPDAKLGLHVDRDEQEFERAGRLGVTRRRRLVPRRWPEAT